MEDIAGKERGIGLIESQYSPVVSVIITNYNFARYLDECLLSVRNQSYKDLDIIVVDDGSSDHSREIIAQHEQADTRVRSVFKPNGGQASAFNAGFILAKGDIICFLDSDDTWMHEKVELVRAQFDEGNYSVVQHNQVVIDEHSKQAGSELWPNVSFSGNLLDQYFRANHTGYFSTTSGLACRKADLARVFPIDEGAWRICADVPLTRPLPLFGEILTLKNPLGSYRIHGRNTWMGGEKQARRLENMKMHCEYTNSVLNQFGESRRIDFEKSLIWKQSVPSRQVSVRSQIRAFIMRLPGGKHVVPVLARIMKTLRQRAIS